MSTVDSENGFNVKATFFNEWKRASSIFLAIEFLHVFGTQTHTKWNDWINENEIVSGVLMPAKIARWLI